MTQRSAIHATFVVERVYAAPPARVFSAFADPEKKAKWFKGPDEWGPGDIGFDFRVGHGDHSIGGPPGDPPHRFHNRYLEIIPNTRIVYAYWMHHGDPLASASIATLEFKPEGDKTRLVMTEVGTFLDGWYDAPGREEGTQWLLEKVAEVVEEAA